MPGVHFQPTISKAMEALDETCPGLAPTCLAQQMVSYHYRTNVCRWLGRYLICLDLQLARLCIWNRFGRPC